MYISQFSGKFGSESSLSTSDLRFYNAERRHNKVRGEDNLCANLQTLLNQLVDKTKAGGGMLSYNRFGTRKFLINGDIKKKFEMSERDRSLLLAGEYFVKGKTHIYPISNNNHLLGIICINVNRWTWKPLCKDLAYAYAYIAAQSFKMHRKQHALSEPPDSLFKKKQELEQIQKYNQNLLSITAHDLSSPINAVSGYLEMIDECLGNKEDANKIYHYYKRIQSGVNHVSDMLTQLNEVVKLEKGFLSLSSAKVDINWIIKEVCDLLKANAAKKEIDLQVSIKGEAIYAEVDVLKFKRVIYNLVSNAIKYSRKHQQICVQTSMKTEWVYVHVRDNGTGIPEKAMNSIFDPFVKHHSGKDYPTSYGLGLYISSYFMELMNGKIVAESKLGEGSTFTVVMPQAAAPANQSQTA
jgi:signal transduction histidine kinase